MFCQNCGAQIDDRAAICVHCGASVSKKKSEDSGNAGWWWLGFLLPTVGLILWAVWHGDTPLKAKKVGVGALWGFGVSIALSIFAFVLYFVVFALIFNSAFYYM